MVPVPYRYSFSPKIKLSGLSVIKCKNFLHLLRRFLPKFRIRNPDKDLEVSVEGDPDARPKKRYCIKNAKLDL